MATNASQSKERLIPALPVLIAAHVLECAAQRSRRLPLPTHTASVTVKGDQWNASASRDLRSVVVTRQAGAATVKEHQNERLNLVEQRETARQQAREKVHPQDPKAETKAARKRAGEAELKRIDRRLARLSKLDQEIGQLERWRIDLEDFDASAGVSWELVEIEGLGELLNDEREEAEPETKPKGKGKNQTKPQEEETGEEKQHESQQQTPAEDAPEDETEPHADAETQVDDKAPDPEGEKAE